MVMKNQNLQKHKAMVMKNQNLQKHKHHKRAPWTWVEESCAHYGDGLQVASPEPWRAPWTCMDLGRRVIIRIWL